MPEVKLGLEAVLTIDGVEITNVKDLTVSLEKAEADASTARTTAGVPLWEHSKMRPSSSRCSTKKVTLPSDCFKVSGAVAILVMSASATLVERSL